MPPKRPPPQGEFAWIIDGKTEYYGQLVKPLSASERDESQDDSSVEVEVRWTHNGKFEWVTLDRVRAETNVMGSRRRVATRKTTKLALKSPKPRQDTASPKPKSDEKSSPIAEKTTKGTGKRSAGEMEQGMTSSLSITEKKTLKSTPEKAPEKTSAQEPPPKKRKRDGATGLFASLSSQVVEAKNAVLSGFSDVYKELFGKSPT